MKPWFAQGARRLLEARESGLMPEGAVIVSMLDRDIPGALVVKKDMPVDRMNWRMLVNLDVYVAANRSADLSWLLETTSRIAQCRPANLHVRFEDGDELHDVEVGEGLHLPSVGGLPAVHSFDWVPINCSGTQMGARLRKALIQKHPRWTAL
jgi:hypothetical protein